MPPPRAHVKFRGEKMNCGHSDVLGKIDLKRRETTACARGAGGRGERQLWRECRPVASTIYPWWLGRHSRHTSAQSESTSATRAGGDVRSKQPKHDPGTKRMSGKKLSLRLIFRTLLPILPSICVSEVPLDARRAGRCSRSHLNGSEMAAFGSSRKCRSEVGSNRTALL